MAENTLINSEIDNKFQTLLSNANAARVISQTIEGTLGPKGLDIMMLDKFGDVVISNDGVTILNLMEVTHPVARMIINAAKSQQSEVGDGTTTATIIAGALVSEGAAQVLKGVPVTQVIQGMEIGIRHCLELIESRSRAVQSLDESCLFDAACIAGRGQRELAGLVIEGAHIIGRDGLMLPDYKFSDAVLACEAVDSRVFTGIIVNREALNLEMPLVINNASILVVDDALAPGEIDAEAKSTESGFQYYLKNKEQYQNDLFKICGMGINLVLTDRSIDDIGEQILTDAGIIALQRVSRREMDLVCKHTGARKIKRHGLSKDKQQLSTYLGKAARVEIDQQARHTIIYNGGAEKMATILIGAATEEVVDERERIAKDAAAAVQAALQSGVVPGAGALEVWLAGQLEEMVRQMQGMSSYGVLCVKEALLKPFTCIVSNAGFNPLEKLRDVIAQQMQCHTDSLGMDCDSGEIVDVFSAGIVDPTRVKLHALKTAGEVATAILKINTIIKMRDGNTPDIINLE
ncbi:Chaperonin Cpn60/TCP-1 [Syntrophomonas zehnderi OL-4]|uniref:Chaperonin Cpn60/TCP-1 n=1 Tax=Syntrophomonas zehnderi OL-4 TaxID=690567 RepID=A0A0E4GCI8_9FIRM|nr:TCP-1/cpn60 chaperonin family protein [Syntrophomonas zehnderi]CFX98858.1 Chaperonin Cpn60/TCP-1 [Syntrophomonas zehnderi OL-4]